ncbi:MAG TPA: deoxyribose-phosphate aldolase [Eudoraea sp.]|nr:deoxyribose-phosphate aldolase [Eudoraea sp.]
MIRTLAKLIDHSILHPAFGRKELREGCALALKYEVASVCVKPYMVVDALLLLKDNDVNVGCVVGFPAGNSTIETKVFETRQACEDGAEEIDMVINIAKALEGDWDYVEEEIGSVSKACHEHAAVVKVIFETDYIDREADIIRLCDICTRAGVDYVKTSTGFGFVKHEDGTYSYTGATIPNLILMKNNIGPGVKLKASGGVRTLDQLLAVYELGCSRVGATATEAIMEEAIRRFQPPKDQSNDEQYEP